MRWAIAVLMILTGLSELGLSTGINTDTYFVDASSQLFTNAGLPDPDVDREALIQRGSGDVGVTLMQRGCSVGRGALMLSEAQGVDRALKAALVKTLAERWLKH